MGRFRTSKAEQARRREMMKSKNAETARRELLSRDKTRPLTESEIESELKRLQVIIRPFIFNMVMYVVTLLSLSRSKIEFGDDCSTLQFYRRGCDITTYTSICQSCVIRVA